MTSSTPRAKWNRQLSPYAIMGDVNCCDLKGDGRLQILVATSDDGCLHCLNGDGSDAWIFQPRGERLASTISVCEPDARDPAKLVLAASRARSLFALEGDGRVRWCRSLPAFSIFGGPTAAGPPGSQMILLGGDGGRLFCLDTEGRLLWLYRAKGPIHQGASAGDVDGNGRTEIFFGSQDTYLYSLRDDGSLRWRYKTRSIGDGIASRPMMGDIDLDGRIEVVFGSWDHHVYCLEALTGQLRWEKELKGRIRSGLAMADLDRDGKQEILAGDVFGLACLDSEGTPMWEFRSQGEEMVVAVPPVIGDVDGDGEPDIVFGTQSGSIYALTGEGRLIWSIPLGEDQIQAAPLIADVDGDGYLEVVYATAMGRVVCLETRGSRYPSPPWPQGGRTPSLNPVLIPEGAGRAKTSTLCLGDPVTVEPAFDGGIALSPEKESVGRSGVRIWWDVRPEQASLKEASPVHLYMESPDPDRPVRGELAVTIGGKRRAAVLRAAVSPPSGSLVARVGLGGLPPRLERSTISVEYKPMTGDGERGPDLIVRRIARRGLLARARKLRKQLEELDRRPRQPWEDLTRALVYKCLAYAETDARGQDLGRADTMLSELEEQIRQRGYSWDPPAKPPSRRVTVDEEGRVLVDRRPFFPLGLYNVSEAEDVRRLSELGFNTIFNAGSADFLSACDDANMMVIGHGPGENIQDFSSLSRIRKYMEDLYWRPCLLAWYLVDEPSLRNVPVDVIRRASELVKMIDPHHLTLICDGAPHRSKPYQALADVASPAYYPIWKQHSVTLVARCVDETVASVRADQPVWFVVQAWTWRNIRFPTVQEERCMTYLAVIHGARGISWYAYKYPDKQVLMSVYENAPELWQEILREVRELRELAPVLMGRRPEVHVDEDGPARVDWCVVERDDQVVLMVCNPTKVQVTHAFDVGDMDGVEVLWEGRFIGDVRGALRDTIGPMSVRIYRGRRPGASGVT